MGGVGEQCVALVLQVEEVTIGGVADAAGREQSGSIGEGHRVYG